jgi:hypothetical protein
MSLLVPVQPQIARRRSPARPVVQCVGDSLAADIRVFRIDARTLMYVVRVASMVEDAAGRLTGVLHGGDLVDLGGLSVAAGSIAGARLTVTPPEDDFDTVYLEVRSRSALLRIEAPRVPARRAGRFMALSGGFAMLATMVVCAAILTFTRPQSPPPVAIPLAQAPPAPVAVAPPAPARIVSFSIRRDAGGYGDSVLASYLAVADAGTLTLSEPGGKVVASAPFTHVGTSRLLIPAKYKTAPLVARLTVHRGATDAVAAIALSAMLPASALDGAMEMPEAVTPLDSVSARTGFSGLIGAEGRAVAGRVLRVRIMPGLTFPHVELQDATGATLAVRDLPSGATHVALPLPPALHDQTYYLVLRYTENGAEDTVVRTIVAAAR